VEVKKQQGHAVRLKIRRTSSSDQTAEESKSTRHRLNCTTSVVHSIPCRTTTPRVASYSVSLLQYCIRADVIVKAENWYVVSLMYSSSLSLTLNTVSSE